LFDAQVTPTTYCGRKDYVNLNSSDTIGNRTCDLPAGGILPQPTERPRAAHETRKTHNSAEL